MSGREAAVGAGLFIMAVGILASQTNQDSPARKPAAPRPVPAHTEIIHTITTHTVTRVVNGFPLAGWQLMLIAIVALIVAAGTAITIHNRRQLWPSTWMT